MSGVARGEAGTLKVRNRIYEHVFDRRWIRQHLPDAERRRQQEAYRRGVARTSALAGAVIAMVGGLAAFAFTQRDAARRSAAEARRQAQVALEQKGRADYNLYIANMHLAPQAWENNDVGHLTELLQEPPDYAERGFEWHYWNRLTHLDLLTLRGHSGDVVAAFSPDGKRIVTTCVYTGSPNNSAKVWDTQTGELVHTSVIAEVSLALSPDGNRILGRGPDKIPRISDVQTGKEVCTLKGYSGSALSGVFSADGKRVVSTCADNTAKVWDACTGVKLLTLTGIGDAGYWNNVAFSPNGKRIAIACADRTVKVWDASTGHKLLTLKGHSGLTFPVAFSPDSKRIVTGNTESDEETVIVWDASTGKGLFTLKGHSIIGSAAFSPDGKRIATGSMDGTITVWDAQTDKRAAGAVQVWVWEPSAMKTELETVRQPTRAAREILTLKRCSGFAVSVAFSPDGRRILAGGRGTAEVWNAEADQEHLTLKGHKGEIGSAAFSPDGSRIVTGCADRIARVWDAQTGRVLLTLEGHTDEIIPASFSPDGKRILTGSVDRTAKVWDAQTGRKLVTLKGHKKLVRWAAFSPDGNRIVTASHDGTAKIWNAETGAELLTLDAHNGKDDYMMSAAFSPDGERIVTGGLLAAQVWSARTGHLLLKLGLPHMTYTVAFSPDGRRIVTGSSEGNATVWDAQTGEAILKLKGHADIVFSAVYSPDGKRIVTGSFDHTAKVWDAQTGKETLTLKGHSDHVFSAVYSPDGKRIVTASRDATARVWYADQTRISAAPKQVLSQLPDKTYRGPTTE
jgi:WD40 repeat protein